MAIIDHELVMTYKCSKPTKKEEFTQVQNAIRQFNDKFCVLAKEFKGFWIDKGWLSMDEDKEEARVMEYDIVFSFVNREGMIGFQKKAEEVKGNNVSLRIL